MYDIIVAGGGPAGNKAASLMAEGHSVIVLEEHTAPGRPVQCAGLISDEAVRLSGVKPTVLNELYGANVIFPNGRSIPVRSNKRKAVLIDRAELDAMMAEKAEECGAVHMYSARYEGHTVKEGTVHVNTNRGTLSSAMLIGADGHNSATAKTVPDNGPREYIRGIQADIRHRMEDQEMINIRIGEDTAPGFFSWEIPFGDMTRVGLCTTYDAGLPSEYLKSLLKKTGLADCDIVNKYCGRIPLGGRRRTYADHMMLIGDAACHVKPVSGGGLQPSFRAAYALSETADEAFDEGDFSKEFLSVYEKRWKKDIGRELKRGYRLRKMYTSMDDGELNRVSELMDKENIREILNGGDIDHPSDIALRLMKDPVTMLRLTPMLFKAAVRGK